MGPETGLSRLLIFLLMALWRILNPPKTCPDLWTPPPCSSPCGASSTDSTTAPTLTPWPSTAPRPQFAARPRVLPQQHSR